MDIATLIGMIAGFGLMIFGMVWGKDFSAVKTFLDMPSALITFGGSLGCLLSMYPLNDFLSGLKTIALFYQI